MGDEKKKSGGRKSGTVTKLFLLVVLALIGAEVFARVTSQYEWSPWIRVHKLIKGQT